jgi:DNA-binding IclR family transcriptional regulator
MVSMDNDTTNVSASPRKARGIQSIEIGARLLVALVAAGQALSLRDLAGAAGLAPAQAHAYLTSFRRIDLVEQDPASGKYSLGSLCMRLGMARMRSHDRLRAASEAAISLSKRLGLMACVVVWGPQAPTVVQVQEGAHQLNLNIHEGTLFSVAGTASGRIFGALSNSEAVSRRIEDEINGAVSNQGVGSPRTRQELESDLAAVRKQGFSIALGKPVPGINAVSAPIYDARNQLLAALTLIGSEENFPLGEGDSTPLALVEAIRSECAAPRSNPANKVTLRDFAGTSERLEGRGVQSIEVGALLLYALVEVAEPTMLRDLARKAGIAPAQAHAYLVSFRNSGLVEQEGQAGSYRLGSFSLQLAIARMRSFDPLRMAADAIVELATETGLTVALAVWGAFGPTVVHIREGVDQVHINTRPGTVYSVSGTATGRLFAAFLPDHLIRMTLKQERSDGRARRVGQTKTYSQLKSELNLIRSQNYATIDTPPIPGINAISAPVFDHVGQMLMAVTLIGPAESLDRSVKSPFIPILLRFTGSLSSKLGFDGRSARGAEFESVRTISKPARPLKTSGPEQRRAEPARG